MTRALRIVGSRSIEKSSMRTKTMLGRLAVGFAGRTAGAAVALVTDPRRTVSPAARLVVGTPHAAASSAVTLIATIAIGARRMLRPRPVTCPGSLTARASVPFRYRTRSRTRSWMRS